MNSFPATHEAMTTAGACVECAGKSTSPDTGAAAGADAAGRGREGLGRRRMEEEGKEQQQERLHWLQHGGKVVSTRPRRHDG